MPKRLCHLLVLAIAAATLPAARGEDADDKPFTRSGCQIHFPKGWTLLNVPGAQAFVFARAPDADRHDGEQFFANLNINRTTPSKLELLAAAKEFQTRHKDRYHDYTPTDEPAEVTVNGHKAVAFGGTFTAQGTKLRNKQWYVPAGDRGYWITLTTLASAWSTRAPAGEAAVNTFTVLVDKK